MAPIGKIHFIFEDSHLNTAGIQHFKEAFSAETMTNLRLANYCGALNLKLRWPKSACGQPYADLDVRIFMRQLHCAWQHSAFFCDLSNDFLLIMALCQLDRLSVIEFDSLQRAAVNYDRPELQAFFRDGCQRIRQLGSRAGVSPEKVRERQQAFVGYFGRRLRRPGC